MNFEGMLGRFRGFLKVTLASRLLLLCGTLEAFFGLRDLFRDRARSLRYLGFYSKGSFSSLGFRAGGFWGQAFFSKFEAGALCLARQL